MTLDDHRKHPLTGPLKSDDPASPPADQWPLRSYLVLTAQPQAAADARKHARMIADDWGLGDLSTATALIVSEFVTNAIRASTGQYDGQNPNSRPLDAPPPIELRLFSDKRQILIQVWDVADGQPTVRPIDPLEESGRGLNRPS